MNDKYALLLDAEARRHATIARLTPDAKLQADHEEIMLALWAGAEALRREAKPWPGHCPKSGTRRRLRLTPLPRAEFRRAAEL